VTKRDDWRVPMLVAGGSSNASGFLPPPPSLKWMQRWFDDALDGLDLTASLDTPMVFASLGENDSGERRFADNYGRVRDGFTRELDRLRAMRDGDPPAPQTENEALLADLRARFGTTDPALVAKAVSVLGTPPEPSKPGNRFTAIGEELERGTP
jgi:hypothetical protein